MAGKNDADFDRRAAGLLGLLLPHRQYAEAVAGLREFELTARPGYEDAGEVTDEDAGLSFDGEDEEGGDAHVQALMIVGPSGTGKSGILDTIERRPEYRSVFEGQCDVRPVVRLDVPDLPTPKEVVREICVKLRSPVPGRWTRGQVARHLRGLFRDVGLRFLLMDEAHVLVEDLTARQVVVNARFLKFLLVTCRAPIILAGEEPLEGLLRHKALERRMQPPIRLGPYVWNAYPDVEEWMGLSGSLAAHLGFEDSAVCNDVDLAMRLYLDTGGIIGLLAKRLIEAGRLANAAGRGDLSRDELSRAWRRWGAPRRIVAADPFAIVEARPGAERTDPYAAAPELLKELWTARFHPGAAAADGSRPTRRGGRGGGGPARSFGR